LLLKSGIDLCTPIEQKQIAGKAVYSIANGKLIACLTEKITQEDVEPLAQGIIEWQKSLTPSGDTMCVFRDNAFVDDVAKTNLAAILNQHGLTNMRSL
jgi:adenine-specific DNA-methyltransferase